MVKINKCCSAFDVSVFFKLSGTYLQKLAKKVRKRAYNQQPAILYDSEIQCEKMNDFPYTQRGIW